MKHHLIPFLLLFTLMPSPARAGGEEVVVIYNKKMPESKAVADHYAAMRNVPSGQVYGFNLPTGEEMSREVFRDSLQLPLAKKLETDGLWEFGKTTLAGTNGRPQQVVRRVVASKIRYAVLCYGVPLRIAHDPNWREGVPAGVLEALRRNSAAVDSELTLLPLIGMDLPITGPLQNWTYATTNRGFLHPTNGILLVSRLDGPSPEIARGLVDKALQAERDGLWGRAYFDGRGFKPAESNYFIGDQFILGAAQISRGLGFETVVDDQPATFDSKFPMSQIALYAGWYEENVSGPFKRPKVEFMPGAFAYHLHSFSAVTVRSPTNRWVGPLLAKGAACTMGSVEEPYVIFTPNITVFLERWAVGQYTFAEAAWTSQLGLSWQNTVIGDPLYRPFGKLPEQLHAELAAHTNQLIEWSFLRLVNATALRGVPASQLVESLENLPVRTNSAVLTEKLADLCAQQGKPESALQFYQDALALNPSPQQRIRLRFLVAGRFEAAGKKKETYETLWKVIDENPDYPAKFDIMKRLLDLAVVLGDKDQITRCVQGMQKYAPTAD